MTSTHRSLRYFPCPQCGESVRFSALWVVGVEKVFRCKECGRNFKTGYKMGAVWLAVSLTLALATANLCVWIFTSVTLPLFVLAVIPLWVLYGFLLRRWWLIRRARRADPISGDKNPA